MSPSNLQSFDQMATPQRNERTLELRALSERLDRLPLQADDASQDFDDAEETTRVSVPELPPVPKSEPARDPWSRVPVWVRVVAVLIPIVAAAVAQILAAVR